MDYQKNKQVDRCYTILSWVAFNGQ